MNYILYNSNTLPHHINDCISNIRKVDPNSNVYLISDKETKYKKVTSIIRSDITSDQTQDIINLNIYKNTNYEKNPLWEASLIRIFALRDLVGRHNLQDIIHFDNDVLTYTKADEVADLFIKNKVNITRLNEKELVFGYSYFYDFKILDNLCNRLYELIMNKFHDKKWKNNPLNEMRLLQMIYFEIPEFFNILNSYPLKNNAYVFDPAVYGQIVGGSHFRPRRLTPKRVYKVGSVDTRRRYLPRGGWLDISHEVTDKFLTDKTKLTFKNKVPFLKNKNGTFKIVNLHIHSKELRKYKL
jgi:hypothetical protein